MFEDQKNNSVKILDPRRHLGKLHYFILFHCSSSPNLGWFHQMLPIINIGEVSQVTRIVTRVYSSCLLLNQFQSKITITCFVNLSILVGTRVLPRFITLKTCYDLYIVMIITCYKFNRLFPGLWSRQHQMDFPPGLASPARSHWEEVRFSPEVLPPAKKIGCEEVAERPATMITWGLPIPGYMCYLNLWWNCIYIYHYVYSIYVYIYIYWLVETYEFVNGKDDIPYMKWKKINMFETTNQIQ